MTFFNSAMAQFSLTTALTTSAFALSACGAQPTSESSGSSAAYQTPGIDQMKVQDPGSATDQLSPLSAEAEAMSKEIDANLEVWIQPQFKLVDSLAEKVREESDPEMKQKWQDNLFQMVTSPVAPDFPGYVDKAVTNQRQVEGILRAKGYNYIYCEQRPISYMAELGMVDLNSPEVLSGAVYVYCLVKFEPTPEAAMRESLQMIIPPLELNHSI